MGGVTHKACTNNDSKTHEYLPLDAAAGAGVSEGNIGACCGVLSRGLVWRPPIRAESEQSKVQDKNIRASILFIVARALYYVIAEIVITELLHVLG